jgi:hypothetical protein
LWKMRKSEKTMQKSREKGKITNHHFTKREDRDVQSNIGKKYKK